MKTAIVIGALIIAAGIAAPLARAGDSYAKAYWHDDDRQHGYYVNGKVLGHDISMLVDTGATETLVNKQLLNGLYPIGVSRAELADGQISTALRYVVPLLCVDDVCVQNMPVVATTSDSLLGTDFLHYVHAETTIEDDFLVIHGTY
jgi:predicted aspartyl protease